MKKFNYFHNKQPITKAEFEHVVPKNWEYEVEYGTYSWGYYRACEIEIPVQTPDWWNDLYTDASGQCFSDADPGL
jgi:hypothetical protein